jgi:hypothetical protein
MNAILSEILGDGLKTAVQHVPEVLGAVGSKENIIKALEAAGEDWLALEMRRLYGIVGTFQGPVADDHVWAPGWTNLAGIDIGAPVPPVAK